MRLLGTWCLLAGLVAHVAGCSRMETDPCAPDARYSTARSTQPVQIPDDLSPPDETNALRLPPDPARGAPVTAGECLETPPSFFGESTPFRASAESDEDGESRRERRERRRSERREERADERPEPPAEQEESAPGSDDRVIDN